MKSFKEIYESSEKNLDKCENSIIRCIDNSCINVLDYFDFVDDDNPYNFFSEFFCELNWCDDNTVEVINELNAWNTRYEHCNNEIMSVTVKYNPATKRLHIDSITVLDEDIEDAVDCSLAEWKQYINNKYFKKAA